jgi:hypothetical protein
MAGHEDIWYATNIEICRYVKAVRALDVSADGTMIYNPTATEIWFTVYGALKSVKSGETIKL